MGDEDGRKEEKGGDEGDHGAASASRKMSVISEGKNGDDDEEKKASSEVGSDKDDGDAGRKRARSPSPVLTREDKRALDHISRIEKLRNYRPDKRGRRTSVVVTASDHADALASAFGESKMGS